MGDCTWLTVAEIEEAHEKASFTDISVHNFYVKVAEKLLQKLPLNHGVFTPTWHFQILHFDKLYFLRLLKFLQQDYTNIYNSFHVKLDCIGLILYFLKCHTTKYLMD